MVLLTACAGVSAGLAHAQSASSDPRVAAETAQRADSVARAFAERFAGEADELLAAGADPLAIRIRLALLDLARTLNPDEIRFQRAAATTAIAIGDRDTAIDALQAVRRLMPGDQLAQIRLVDLLSDRMETVDQRIRYLEQVAGTASVAAPVRSHAATLLYDLRVERGEESAAEATLKRAIELNPINTSALRIRHLRAVNASDRAAAIKALEALLRANPADARGLAEVARLASGAARHETAAQFIEYAMAASAVEGTDVGLSAIDYFASLALAGQNQTVATQLAAALGAGAPDPQALWLLDLVMRRLNTPADQLQPVTDRTRQMLVARIAMLSRRVRGLEAPQSLDELTMPDVDADMRVMSEGGLDLRAEYGSTLSELAMFDLYRDVDPPASMLAAIKAIRGSDALGVTMLEGWQSLRVGLVDDARLKLSAAAQSLPLAQALLISMDARASVPDAQARAQQLVDTYPAGVESLLIEHLLAPARVKREPLPASAEVDSLVERISRSVALVTTDPRRIWQLRVRPQATSFAFGEPMLADLTLTNRSGGPIGIGPGSMIKPLVLLDANVRGMGPVLAGYTAVELWGPVVLGPGESWSQAFRVDAGRLRAAMQQSPLPSLALSITATANPVISGNSVLAGIAGQASVSGSMIERRATTLQDPARRAELQESVTTGSPEQRMFAAELLARVAASLRTPPQGTPAPGTEAAVAQRLAEAKRVADELTESLTSAARLERDGRVASFLKLCEVIAAAEPGLAPKVVDELLASNEPVAQTLALLLLRGAPAELRAEMLPVAVTSASHPSVAALAQALLEMPAQPEADAR
jgi:tetratricopeptide (TPR) repeat protein